MVQIILGVLGIFGLCFLFIFLKDVYAHRSELGNASWPKVCSIGFVTSFFDVFGIGNFATNTALLKIFKQIDDKDIPGTLNVCSTITVIMNAFIFITVIEVEPVTLIGMFISATVGAYFGASIISRFSAQKVRLTMGVALMVTAFLMLAGQMGWMPGGGEAIGLSGAKLAIAIGGNFILGMLMTAGIGAYAPCMALVYFLGMSPRVSFPIMMGSCAFLMPIASMKFIKEGAYDRKVSLGIMCAGVFAVLIATTMVKSFPLDTLKWIVIVVILYTSVTMLQSVYKHRKGTSGTGVQEAA